MIRSKSKRHRPEAEDAAGELSSDMKAAAARKKKRLKREARAERARELGRREPTAAQLRQRDRLGRQRIGAGRGPKKGTGGRPPDAWKELMGRLVNRPSTIKALKKVLRNQEHGAWFGAFKFSAEQKYGKARESLDVSGKLSLEDILSRSRDAEE